MEVLVDVRQEDEGIRIEDGCVNVGALGGKEGGGTLLLRCGWLGLYFLLLCRFVVIHPLQASKHTSIDTVLDYTVISFAISGAVLCCTLHSFLFFCVPN